MADAGWYPQQDGTQRYWDGTAWTNHIEQPAVIPAYVAPPAPVAPVAPAAAAIDSPAQKSAWFKTRTAVGVGGLLLGLAFGASSAGGEDTSKTDELTKNVATLKATNEELEADVADLSTQEPGISQEDVDQQIADAVKAAKVEAEAKRKESVTKVIAEERRKADARVDAAEAKAAAEQPRTLTGGGGTTSTSTDPRFGTCGEALDNGYGNYVQGVDPEYDWYQDRDNDGVVCE